MSRHAAPYDPARDAYVGSHTPAGIAARRRRDRRAEQRAQAEAAKADLLGQAEALAAEVPTLRLVAGGAA